MTTVVYCRVIGLRVAEEATAKLTKNVGLNFANEKMEAANINHREYPNWGLPEYLEIYHGAVGVKPKYHFFDRHRSEKSFHTHSDSVF